MGVAILNDGMSVLKTIAYNNSLIILVSIIRGTTHFNELALVMNNNHGALSKLLKSLIEARLVEADVNGYQITEIGVKVVLYAIWILEIESGKTEYSDIKRILYDKLVD